MKILLLNGHDDFGNGGASNVAYGTEQKLTRDFSKILESKLIKYGHAVSVFNPEYTDRSMYTILNYGGSYDFTKYDLVVELHFNAGVADFVGNSKLTGTEILVHKNATDIAHVARILEKLSSAGLRSRGVKRRSDLLVMGHCYSQAVPHYLWEICFIDDDDDMKYFSMNKDIIADIFAANISSDGNPYMSYYGLVDTDDGTPLNIRSKMNFQPTTIIGQIPNHTIVSVSPVDFLNDEWVTVMYGGVHGYVVKKFINEKRTGTVNTGSGKERLRIRKQPNTDSEIVGYLNNKSTIHIYKTKRRSNGEVWYMIGNLYDILGYVSAKFVDLDS